MDDSEKARIIFQFMQAELSKYFSDEVPVILNPVGEQRLKGITGYGRLGYSFEITNNEILEYFYTCYALSLKEIKFFKVVKNAVLGFI